MFPDVRSITVFQINIVNNQSNKKLTANLIHLPH